MVEEAGNKKVEAGEEGNGKRRRPIESVTIGTSNGLLSFSVWEGGSVTVRVSRRKDNSDEYETIWSGRINPIDFINQFGDLKIVARTAQEEIKKLLKTEI